MARVFTKLGKEISIAVKSGGPDPTGNPRLRALMQNAKAENMYAENVTTLISDSGITRYRITTPAWYIYDHSSEPYWAFPKGVHLQRFDESFHGVQNSVCPAIPTRNLSPPECWEMQTERSYPENRRDYHAHKSHRYALSRFWKSPF